MDTANAAFDFIHAEPAGPLGNDMGLAECKDSSVTTVEAREPQLAIVSPFPGAYAIDRLDADRVGNFHWSAWVPYIVAGICAVLLYVAV